MRPTKKPLDIEQLVRCLGQSIGSVQQLLNEDLVLATQSDIDRYFPYKISYTLRNPSHFSLFNIPVDEAYTLVDDSGKIKAIFFVLNNDSLIEKMNSAIGKWEIASSISFSEDADPSFYRWKYKEGFISVTVNAFKFRFVDKVVRDNAMVIFNNGDMKSYMTYPKDHP
jgi:hypothetical protein